MKEITKKEGLFGDYERAHSPLNRWGTIAFLLFSPYTLCWGTKNRKRFLSMPKSTHYKVAWSAEQSQHLLVGPEGMSTLLLLEDTKDWLQWLEQHHAFAFFGQNGHLNLLKERRKRGGEGYWYAYQRDKRHIIKRYIGRNEQVTMQRLEEVAAILAADEAARTESNATCTSSLPSSTQLQTVEAFDTTTQFAPLLLSKLQLPRLQKSLLPREHLLTLLDRGVERKLTLIAGPAGYGKTTLVGQWIAARSADTDAHYIGCVTLDEGDNDPLRFWRYVVAACQKFRPDFGKETLELLRAHRLLPFKSLEMMLTILLNELARLEHSCVLVLDDFHVISSTVVTKTLNFFLEHLPSSMHLLLLIRGDPPFSLTRLRASNELIDIYPPMLAFSLEETRAFFEQELSITLPNRILQQVCKRIDGWPTALRLLTRELQSFVINTQEIEQALTVFAGSNWSIRDYFLNEVLRTLPIEQQDFLLQTSILPRITASLCDAITGHTNSEQQIKVLQGNDLFLIPLDSTGEWSRYHFLFGEAMQQEARTRLGDELLSQLSLRASIWYEEHGLRAEAIETALNAAQFTRSAHLMKQFIAEKHQENIFTLPETYKLKRWLGQLPTDELARHPELCLHYALTLLFMQMEDTHFTERSQQIQQWLQLAEQKWRDANKTTKLAEVFAFRALLARQEGNLLQAVTWAKQSLAWLPVEDRTWRNLSLTVVSVGEILDGNLRNARPLLLEALKLCEQQGNFTYARATRGMIAWTYFEQGELRQAAEQFRQMQAEAQTQEDNDDIARTALGLAGVLYSWNRLEEAEQAASRALALGERMRVEEFQVQATTHLALIEHALGQTSQAQQRLMTWLARGQRPTTPYSYQLLREVQATLAFIQLTNGDFIDVEHWLSSIEGSEETLPQLRLRREQLLHARLLLSQKAISAAIARLEALSASAQQTGHDYLCWQVQVVLSLAYARQGSHTKAREQLYAVLKSALREGCLRLFLDEGQEMATLLRNMLPYISETAALSFTQHLLSLFTAETHEGLHTTSSTIASLYEPLSAQEKKVLRLLAAGNSNAEIARQFVVSVNTVRTQIQSIYRKLNVNNRIEASTLAKQYKLL